MLIIILPSHLNDLWIVISMLGIDIRQSREIMVLWVEFLFVNYFKLFAIISHVKMIYCECNGLNMF